MRFLHNVARRLSIGGLLTAATVIGSIDETAMAQTPTTQRLPQPGRSAAAAGTRPAAQQSAATAAASPPATQTAPPAAGTRVAKGTAPAAAAPATGTPPVGPTPPFLLNSREQESLDAVLAQWEKKNTDTKTFKCEFERYEYDMTLKGTEAEENRRSKALGEVKYKQPDHGMFRVTALEEFNENKHAYENRTVGLDHWVCDGAAIYEFVPADRKLKVHPLPEEMRGEAIADGPIPFIFGAKADKMKQRDWLREVTPPGEIGKHTWLEAFPKYQHDAANFSSALLLLNPDFTIYGLQVSLPGGQQRTAFIFSKLAINDPLGFLKRDFAAPMTPLGWTKEVDPPPTDPEQPEPKQPAAAPATARQPKGAAPATPAKR